MYIVIPAYKPDERLLALVEQIRDETDYQIVVVNDGSGPAYDAIFSALPDDVTLLTHAVNCGKGRAMKTAFAHLNDVNHNVQGVHGAVIADADGQHLLADIQRVCEELKSHPDCLIIGSRLFTGDVPFRSRFGNKLTRGVFSLASGVKLHDTQTGLRAIPAPLFPLFCEIKGERYEYEMNMLLRAAELGISIREVFIETVYIDENASSHFHVIRDSLKIYAVIFKFIFSSLASFLIDYALYIIASFLTAPMQNSNLSRLISIGSARIISSACNYLMNKTTVFKGSKRSVCTVFKYYLVAAVIFAANYGLLTLMENVLLWNNLLSQALTMLLLYPLSYYLQRMFVFQTRCRYVA